MSRVEQDGEQTPGPVFVVVDESFEGQESLRILEEYGISYVQIPFDSTSSVNELDNPRPPRMLSPRGEHFSLETIRYYAERYGKKGP